MTTTLALPARQRALAALTAIALAMAAFVAGTVNARPAGATTVESTFTAMMNAERSARGLHRLAVRADLVEVARAQAGRMASRGVLYHNPRLTSEVRNWRWVGENVGYGPDAVTVHVAFMNSAPHRANVLDRDYTEVGVGAVVKDGRVWVAEVFRKPLQATSGVARSWQATHPVLRHGDSGRAVLRVQRRLHVRATGYYGTVTRAKVREFQRSKGWKGSGVVGVKTWRALGI